MLGKIATAVVQAVVVIATAVAAKEATKALTKAAVNVSSQVRTKEKTKTKKKTSQQKDEEEYYVYVLRDSEEITKYVGRTKNKTSTIYRHSHNDYRKDLTIDFITEKSVSYATARGLEQLLIIECKTLHPDKRNPVQNQINGLRENHKYYEIYWNAATNWRDEHIVKCG